MFFQHFFPLKVRKIGSQGDAMEVQRWTFENGLKKSGFCKDDQEFKNMKRYFERWKESRLEAQRSNFLSKQWCGNEENAKRKKLFNSDNGGRKESEEEVKKNKEEENIKKEGQKFGPPSLKPYMSCRVNSCLTKLTQATHQKKKIIIFYFFK